ncbi:MAG: protein ImuB [Micromonosporaceae bacterium]
MLLWCPDWPVVAAVHAGDAGVGDPVAVLHANRVIACSPAARAHGVRRGLRKREAQSRCPTLTVVVHDAARDGAAFEPVVAAVEDLAAGVAVLRPGACAVAARGPARYHRGEEQAAERIVEHVAVDAGVEAQIGVADGVFAALLAARAGRIIPPGGTAAFLAELPVAELDRPRLADVLRRLGIRTLGAFAALPAGDVLARFGLDAAIAHRLAAGLDDRPLQVHRPPPDLAVRQEYEDPIDRVDVGAFAARALAVVMHERLAGYGLACTRLEISAVTADGQQLSRVWRHDGLLSAAAIADRARWQLDGWLTHRRLTAGIVALQLAPQGVLQQAGLQPGLWGEAGPGKDRAHRAMHRVQGLLGPDAVLVAVPSGGRDPDRLVTLLPFGDEQTPKRPPGPWPGALPAPYPALNTPAQPVRLLDAAGQPVRVDARLRLSADPTHLHLGNQHVGVREYYGPWPVVERWWDPPAGRRAVRLQVVLDDGAAVLLQLAGGQWTMSGRFD